MALAFAVSAATASAGSATVSVGEWEAPTYAFGDRDPVPCTETTRYPYARYDSCATNAVLRRWKRVDLENDRIRVTILPEIGGRIWGVLDKATGREPVYFNHVVKFRNISTCGAWVSGGIELNFGIIGHSPHTAMPVDWTTRRNADGSVSYFARLVEFVCRTEWQVEVRLGADDRHFTTSVLWYNASHVPAPYYHWMTGAFPARRGMRFGFPGQAWIGHEGDAHPWPDDGEGHDLSRYDQNAFGLNKSYHVVNGDTRCFSVWYPEWKLGLRHENAVGEKYGRKIWIWSHARSGAIWEDLLTDRDGQYVELQSGRCFNQPRGKTVETPFKHATFAPGDVQRFTETWRVFDDEAVTDAGEVAAAAERPLVAPADFNWEGAYGQYVRGQQLLRERRDAEGLACLDRALAIDPCLVPALTEKATLAFRRGRYDETRRLCDKALAVDTYDPLANYLDGAAALAVGDRSAARERLGLAAFSPVCREAARRLMSRAEGRVEEPEGFVPCSGASAELAAEMAADRATAYEEAGRLAEAEALVRDSPCPVCQLRLASLLARQGRIVEAGKTRTRALARPIAGVSPFRREERRPLEEAVAAGGGWKAAYYLAVLESFFGAEGQARQRLSACGDEPDEWVFYVYRARHGGDVVKDLLRAEALGGDWRVGRDLMRHGLSEGNPLHAVEVGQRYLKRYPGTDQLELAYATALHRAGRNRECVDFLATVSVLPSEFGDNAHDTWAAAWRALGREDKAAEYPENLGAGDPLKEESNGK